MTHQPHPDTIPAILFDSCDRCQDLADRPEGIDGESLRELASRDPLTSTEMRAKGRINAALYISQQLGWTR